MKNLALAPALALSLAACTRNISMEEAESTGLISSGQATQIAEIQHNYEMDCRYAHKNTNSAAVPMEVADIKARIANIDEYRAAARALGTIDGETDEAMAHEIGGLREALDHLFSDNPRMKATPHFLAVAQADQDRVETTLDGQYLDARSLLPENCEFIMGWSCGDAQDGGTYIYTTDRLDCTTPTSTPLPAEGLPLDE